MNSRRHFITILPFAGLSVLSACSDKAAPTSAAPAPTPAPESAASPAASATAATQPAATATATGPMVDPAESGAIALGYVADAKLTKDPKHAAGAACGNCALFAGKPGEATGPCPLFTGKQVSASGWCTAYQKKA